MSQPVVVKSKQKRHSPFTTRPIKTCDVKGDCFKKNNESFVRHLLYRLDIAHVLIEWSITLASQIVSMKADFSYF